MTTSAAKVGILGFSMGGNFPGSVVRVGVCGLFLAYSWGMYG